MDHVAIMRKEWGMIPKILSGEKNIESRWYVSRTAPWGRIWPGDAVYFKNSGEPVTARAFVSKVLSFSGLTDFKVRRILECYGRDDGIADEDKKKFSDLFRNKKYCLLVFLERPEEVVPFDINKAGFGVMCAWMIANDIEKIKLPVFPPRQIRN